MLTFNFCTYLIKDWSQQLTHQPLAVDSTLTTAAYTVESERCLVKKSGVM